MKADMNPDALEHFRSGARVAAGSTQTHRGEVEISYWANPFHYSKIKTGKCYQNINTYATDLKK